MGVKYFIFENVEVIFFIGVVFVMVWDVVECIIFLLSKEDIWLLKNEVMNKVIELGVMLELIEVYVEIDL